jgi:hypothetical protein
LFAAGLPAVEVATKLVQRETHSSVGVPLALSPALANPRHDVEIEKSQRGTSDSNEAENISPL